MKQIDQNNMNNKSARSNGKQKILVVSFLFITSFAIKIFYGTTRNIFDSGPDANTYKQMAIDLANLGYLNSSIAGFPIYSPGYPLFLSVNRVLFGDYWITSAQVLQSLLSCLTALIVYSFAKLFLNNLYSFTLLAFLLLHPAFVVLSVSCMYESLLIFFLVLITKISFIKNFRYSTSYFTMGSLIAILIHPRVIPLVMIALYFYIKNQSKHSNKLKLLPILVVNIISCVAISFRNYRYADYFGLAQGAEYGIKFGHPSVGICNSLIECFWVGLSKDPASFLIEMFWNAVKFFSPWSGPLEQGTWFHNISFYTIIGIRFNLNSAIIFSLIFSIVSFVITIVGLANFVKKKNTFAIYTTLLTITLVLTDAIIYGDSRHRLLIFPLITLIQFIFLQEIQKKVRTKKNI